ncbi:MAG: amidohydrolase family protein [Nocardioidaceae bacterium]|nr:amidohydrolase family protein [Nocardioidaceae bacterium]
MILDGGRVLSPGGALEPGRVRVDGPVLGDPRPPPASDEVVVDVAGLLVLPGLVDLHTHVFSGQDAGVDAQAIGPPTGVTTMVDAGSAGAHLIGAFRRTSMPADGPVRVLPFLNIATIGITSLTLSGELHHPPYLSTEAALSAIADGGDIVGVKVRASADVAGPRAVEALDTARAVADETGLPLMVHLGPSPADAAEILARLRAGDVLTHCLTGFGNDLARPGLGPALLAARERGVVFDVGHGKSGFDATVASRLLAQGFAPDTISTDLHAYSLDTVGGLPRVIAGLVALGMPLAQALRAATEIPARVLGRPELGILAPGTPADVAVLAWTEAETDDEHDHVDGFGHHYRAGHALVPVLTLSAGRVVFDPTGLAGLRRP